jgi:hypothetical protein
MTIASNAQSVAEVLRSPTPAALSAQCVIEVLRPNGAETPIGGGATPATCLLTIII